MRSSSIFLGARKRTSRKDVSWTEVTEVLSKLETTVNLWATYRCQTLQQPFCSWNKCWNVSCRPCKTTECAVWHIGGDYFGQHQELSNDSSHNMLFLLLCTGELELTSHLGYATQLYNMQQYIFSILNMHPQHISPIGPFTFQFQVPYLDELRRTLDKVMPH